MYLTLTCKGKDLKNTEIFLKNWKSIEAKKIEILRIVTNWTNKTIYVTYEFIEEGAGVPIHKNDEYVNLGIRRVYGPYGTEASVKTATSKIKARLKEETK